MVFLQLIKVTFIAVGALVGFEVFGIRMVSCNSTFLALVWWKVLSRSSVPRACLIGPFTLASALFLEACLCRNDLIQISLLGAGVCGGFVQWLMGLKEAGGVLGEKDWSKAQGDVAERGLAVSFDSLLSGGRG